MTRNDFNTICNAIIDNIEGGYYNPSYYQQNPEKFAGYEISGETMYGLDRANGGNTVTNSESGKKFWQIVDTAFAKGINNLNYWGDKADGKKYVSAEIGRQLRPLAWDIIYMLFNANAKFLTEKALKAVLSDKKLLTQFIYACWNGSGHFKTFADIMNKAFAEGKSNAQIYDLIQNQRRKINRFFALGADKLDKVVSMLKSNIWLWVVGIAVTVVGIFAFSNNSKSE